ncbi:malonate decarboxylase holo-ACP synthase [Paenibacillus hodogayensis]|uniref:Malonate decarboxylase holo-ACP synthase n=1 Tax=Paenibacillus hodogayensis TaxID=279208 RepID=A0ABV5VPJ6_9BACL
MEVNVHDLLRLKEPDQLVLAEAAPEWLRASVERAPWVVVRRAARSGPLIPVGVRGFTRGERFAAWVSAEHIAECVSPEQLAERIDWKQAVRSEQIRLFRAMNELSGIYEHYSLTWGPAGSIGFELASGVQTISPTSDLDLIIRVALPLDPLLAARLHQLHKQQSIRVDALIETPFGAVALAEYVERETFAPVLLRTSAGPVFVRNPWSSE